MKETMQANLNICPNCGHYFRVHINRRLEQIIDKGTYNGVEVDMVVVNSDGLIGKVVSTTTFTSDVKLLTTSDTNNKISVAISNGKNKLYGLIKDYNYKNNYLEVEGISNTESVSIGDYVLTGGEVPAMVLVDSITRLIPGVIREDSHLEDSFNENYLLDYPTYTKPRVYEGMEVPEVLLSGDHKKIEEYRYNESLKRTELRRPDLLKK